MEDETKTAAYLRQGLEENTALSSMLSRPATMASIFARAVTFDVVILDVMLPGLDGWTIIKTLRAMKGVRHRYYS